MRKIIFFILTSIFSFLFFTKGVFAAPNPVYDFDEQGGFPYTKEIDYTFSYSGSTFAGKLPFSQSIPFYQLASRDSTVISGTPAKASGHTAFMIYVDTEKLLRNNWYTIVKIKANDPDLDDIEKEAKDYHGDVIYYDRVTKSIVFNGWYVGKSGKWQKASVIIANDVDENTPNFILTVSVQEILFAKNGFSRTYSYRFYKETEIGNGKMSQGFIKAMTSTPVKAYSIASSSSVETHNSLHSFLHFSVSPLLWFCDNEFYRKNITDYFECQAAIQPAQINLYSTIWQDMLHMKMQEGNWGIPQGGYDDPLNKEKFKKAFQIPLLDNPVPVPPKCSFLNSFLGLSCLGEWIGYGFQLVKYSVFSLINTLITAVNYIFKFIHFILVTAEEVIDFFKNPIQRIFPKFWFSWYTDTCGNEYTSWSGTLAFTSSWGLQDLTFMQNFANLVSIAVPFAPKNGDTACSFGGQYKVQYKENTKFLDTIFVMISFMVIVFTFANSHKND